MVNLPGYSIRAVRNSGLRPVAGSKIPFARKLKRQGFVDEVVVKLRSGRGGDGGVHFAREPNKRVAPPDGGNGGRGGSVFFKVDDAVAGEGLRGLRRVYRAGDGAVGRSLNRHGANGKDATVTIPSGCVITEVERHDETKELQTNGPSAAAAAKLNDSVPNADGRLDISQKIAGIDTNGQNQSEERIAVYPQEYWHRAKDFPSLNNFELRSEDGIFTLLRGGFGGRGNATFASSINRSPRQYGAGGLPQSVTVKIEYKMLADVGLVGLPNAGKSTLLNAITNAKSTVGYYPFTTISPLIGVLKPNIGDQMRRSDADPIDGKIAGLQTSEVKVDGTSCSKGLNIRIADIPGLIPGASEDRGLGHSFLRHVQRSKVLLLVVDAAAPNPAEDLRMILHELNKFDPTLLATKRALIVANKSDVSKTAKSGNELETEAMRLHLPLISISAMHRIGTTELAEQVIGLVSQVHSAEKSNS